MIADIATAYAIATATAVFTTPFAMSAETGCDETDIAAIVTADASTTDSLFGYAASSAATAAAVAAAYASAYLSIYVPISRQ